MKNKILFCVLAAALFVAGACSSSGTANKTTNTTTTTTNTTNRATTTTNTSNSAASNANSGTSSNTSSSTSSAEGKQDFTLHNQTGVEIHALYVVPHSQDDWSEDILGRDTLPAGESVLITFSPKEKAAMWDLRVEDQAGNAIEWENLNLMEISEVTLHYDNNRPTAEFK